MRMCDRSQCDGLVYTDEYYRLRCSKCGAPQRESEASRRARVDAETVIDGPESAHKYMDDVTQRKPL